MPDEHKTLEQRIADIELNLKKLREEIIGASFPGKERLSLNRVQLQHLNTQSKHRPNRRKNHSLSDWTSDEIQEELWLTVDTVDNKRQFKLQSGGLAEQGSAA